MSIVSSGFCYYLDLEEIVQRLILMVFLHLSALPVNPPVNPPVDPPVDPPPESIPRPSSDGVATAEDPLGIHMYIRCLTQSL